MKHFFTTTVALMILSACAQPPTFEQQIQAILDNPAPCSDVSKDFDEIAKYSRSSPASDPEATHRYIIAELTWASASQQCAVAYKRKNDLVNAVKSGADAADGEYRAASAAVMETDDPALHERGCNMLSQQNANWQQLEVFATQLNLPDVENLAQSRLSISGNFPFCN